MPLERSQEAILAAWLDATKNDIRCAIPATVTHVSTDRQTVDVQVAVNNPLNDDVGNIVTEPAPSFTDVPLGVLRGGGFLIWIPVAVGDSVLLVFPDLSTDVWRSGDGTPQDPGFVGKHTYDSAFALPMIGYDSKMFLDPADSSAAGKLLIGQDGSAAQIRISASDIELGNNATDALALASKVATELGKIVAALASLTVTTGPGAGGTVVAGSPYTTPGSVASTLVKAQ